VGPYPLVCGGLVFSVMRSLAVLASFPLKVSRSSRKHIGNSGQYDGAVALRLRRALH
jgi:hypothetical protein